MLIQLRWKKLCSQGEWRLLFLFFSFIFGRKTRTKQDLSSRHTPGAATLFPTPQLRTGKHTWHLVEPALSFPVRRGWDRAVPSRQKNPFRPVVFPPWLHITIMSFQIFKIRRIPRIQILRIQTGLVWGEVWVICLWKSQLITSARVNHTLF